MNLSKHSGLYLYQSVSWVKGVKSLQTGCLMDMVVCQVHNLEYQATVNVYYHSGNVISMFDSRISGVKSHLGRKLRITPDRKLEIDRFVNQNQQAIKNLADKRVKVSI